MKFRTAKKIIHHNDKYRGNYLNTAPWYKKAVEVYILHRKETTGTSLNPEKSLTKKAIYSFKTT